MANVGQPSGAKDRVGEVVGGRYELLSIIGRGVQSAVYRARDQVHGDLVALKVLQWSDPDAAERLFREARIMSQLQDVDAVRILHQCQTNDGNLALVMELLEGADLASILTAREDAKTRNEFAWMKPIIEPVVRTLEAAHQRGIVHRDLKAENVFVIDPSKGGGVRLLDFGFAKNVRSPGITAMDIVAGSPSYIAPEVWEKGAAKATSRADVYALGVLIFRILAGRPPFTGSLAEIAKSTINPARPSLWMLRNDLPREVDWWVLQVLAKVPEERFMNVTAAWRALAGLLGSR
jgi:serine/threonine-protein kinase